jgi:glycosyltransferase involved in cell wall biosynthesis
MHVIYIHQYFSTNSGSTGTRSYEMSKALLAAGHRVTMVCGLSDNAPPEFNQGKPVNELEVEGIRVLCIGQPYSNRMSFYQRARAFGQFAREASRVTRGIKADLVFATSTPLTVGLPGMKTARRLDVPFVFEVRDLWPEIPIAVGMVRNPLLIWYLRRLERRIYRAADHIIALSPGMREGISATGYPAERVTLIPNIANLELFRPSREPLSDERFGRSEDFRVAYTGAHGLANGLDAVLDAAAEVRRRGEKDVRFVFIGKGGQRDRLLERSQAEGLNDQVSWLGPLPKRELASVLPRMGAGIMPLKNLPAFRYGTSPNKFFDYIASGLPVINNYPGWVAEMIEREKCGKVVPPDDARAFADAVVWLRDHREEAVAMGLRGRGLAEREFSRDVLAERFVRTLESAAGLRS